MVAPAQLRKERNEAFWPSTQVELRMLMAASGLNEGHLRQLVHRHFEPHRYYHGWSHLNDLAVELHSTVLRIRPNAFTKQEMQALALITLCHDCVYDVGVPAGQNEVRSLDVFLEIANTYTEQEMSVYVRKMVTAGILRTADHFQTYDAFVGSLSVDVSMKFVIETFRDLDLSTMADAWDVFVFKNRQIDNELDTEFPPQEYLPKRRRFLQRALGQRIFNTALFEPLEAFAKANLDRALQEIYTD